MRKLVFIFVLLFMVCSCRTSQHSLTEKEIQYIDRHIRDTTVIETKDSVYLERIQKGDTIYEKKYIKEIRYKDRIVYRDSISYQDKTKTEYRLITKKVVPSWCWYLMAANIVIIAFFGFKKYLKWKTKI